MGDADAGADEAEVALPGDQGASEGHRAADAEGPGHADEAGSFGAGAKRCLPQTFLLSLSVPFVLLCRVSPMQLLLRGLKSERKVVSTETHTENMKVQEICEKEGKRKSGKPQDKYMISGNLTIFVVSLWAPSCSLIGWGIAT